MIQQDFSIEKKEVTSFKPLPENIYQVELLDVNVEERPTYDTRNKPDSDKEYEKVFNFQFTLLSGIEIETSNGMDSINGKSLRGRNVWENFVPSYLYISSKHGKNKLYEVIEGLIRRELTKEEEANFTASKLNGLIGRQVRIGVKHKQSGDKTYDRIEQYYPIETMINALSPEEKEKAKIKEKEQTPVEKAASILGGTIVKDEEIPVIQIDEEKDMTMHQGDNMTDSNEIRLEDVPF